MSQNWPGRSMVGGELVWRVVNVSHSYLCSMEWLGLGRHRADLGKLEAPEKLWGLEVFQRGRGSSRMIGENCLFADYFRRYFITLQILFWNSPSVTFLLVNGELFVYIYVWRGARCKGKALVSQVLWHAVKCVFFVSSLFFRSRHLEKQAVTPSAQPAPATHPHLSCSHWSSMRCCCFRQGLGCLMERRDT